jgi:hypothetical protein
MTAAGAGRARGADPGRRCRREVRQAHVPSRACAGPSPEPKQWRGDGRACGCEYGGVAVFVVACWGESEGGMRECVRARVDVGERPARDSRMTTFASRTCSPIPQGGNDLGPEGARHLAGALEKMTGMQRLNLVSHVRVRVRARAGVGAGRARG